VDRQGVGFWLVQAPGWLLFAYLIVAQAIPAFNYDIGVAMGTQEPASRVTEVGVAFWKGFAIGDVIVYIPLLLAGLVGHWRGAPWSRLPLAAALGITIYWPAVCLATVASAQGASGWSLANEKSYWIVLPIIALWGACGLWLILNSRSRD